MNQILIVEDDPYLAQNISEILQDEGFTIVVTTTEEDAFGIICKNDFTLILCDIMLIKGNGLKLLSRVKEILKGKLPPFIFTTALSGRKNQREGMELGADDYLTKPFTGEELVNTVKTNILKREMITASSVAKQTESDITGGDENTKNRFKLEDKIFISKRSSSEFVFIRDIVYIESQREYTTLVNPAKRRFTIKKSMRKWESELPGDMFIRIHRKHILNISFVESIVNLPNRLFRVHLLNMDETLIISQRIGKQLKNSLHVIKNK
jgi:diguanylate cyclase